MIFHNRGSRAKQRFGEDPAQDLWGPPINSVYSCDIELSINQTSFILLARRNGAHGVRPWPFAVDRSPHSHGVHGAHPCPRPNALCRACVLPQIPLPLSRTTAFSPMSDEANRRVRPCACGRKQHKLVAFCQRHPIPPSQALRIFRLLPYSLPRRGTGSPLAFIIPGIKHDLP